MNIGERKPQTFWLAAAAALAMAATAAPERALAQDAGAPQTRVIALKGLDLHPASDAAAKRLLARLDRAAVEACGAPRGSLREYEQAVRHSACWSQSMADVVGRIGSTRLTSVYRDLPPSLATR